MPSEPRSEFDAAHSVICPACDGETIGQLYPGITYRDWSQPAWWPRGDQHGSIGLRTAPGDSEAGISAVQQALQDLGKAHAVEGHAPKRRRGVK